MTRRNHRSRKRRQRPEQTEPLPSTVELARDLVRRGIASKQILDDRETRWLAR